MGSFTIKTSVFQTLMSKAVKGASNSKFNTLTNLMNIVLQGGILSITTTDSDNYLTVLERDVTGDDMNFVVNVDTFSKLISKTSSENIKVSVSDDTISVTGNGTYKLPIQLDVDGSEIKYPSHDINNPEFSGTVKTAVIRSIVQYNKPSLALTMEKPYLTRYMCVEDCVISGDEYNICQNNVKTFGQSVLVAPIIMELLCMCDDEDISYKIYQNNVMFETDKLKLFAILSEGSDQYPVDLIKQITSNVYDSDCVLSKSALISIIDRLSLFINDDDQNGLYMTFTKDGVKLESMKGNAIETVPYQGSNNFKDYTCCIGVDAFRKQLASRSGESVHVFYGDPSTITLKDGNIIQVISLQEDPRFE